MELFGNPRSADGDRELYRVGRCLEDLYPDAISAAHLRDGHVEKLVQWSTAKRRRPLLFGRRTTRG